MDSDAIDSNITDSSITDSNVTESNVTASDDSSSFKPLGSFICDICQGFGDMMNSRGFILKLEGDEQGFDGACYVYTYMHHLNVLTLLESAGSGCKSCIQIRDTLMVPNRHKFNRIVRLYLPARESKHAEPVAGATQLSDDISTATQFAECVKQERAFTEERLRNYNNGRVVLVFHCDTESGPRECSSAFQIISVWALTTPLLPGYELHFFNNPCMSHIWWQMMKNGTSH